MRFAFKPLPGTGLDVARPALRVAVVGPADSVTVLSLVDSGSLHNRFALWVAETAGIDLAGATVERIAVGGTFTQARTVRTAIQLGEFTWKAPVSFCDPWPFDFQLLGQLGFLRWFRMVMEAADETFEITPNET